MSSWGRIQRRAAYIMAAQTTLLNALLCQDIACEHHDRVSQCKNLVSCVFSVEQSAYQPRTRRRPVRSASDISDDRQLSVRVATDRGHLGRSRPTGQRCTANVRTMSDLADFEIVAALACTLSAAHSSYQNTTQLARKQKKRLGHDKRLVQHQAPSLRYCPTHVSRGYHFTARSYPIYC